MFHTKEKVQVKNEIISIIFNCTDKISQSLIFLKLIHTTNQLFFIPRIKYTSKRSIQLWKLFIALFFSNGNIGKLEKNGGSQQRQPRRELLEHSSRDTYVLRVSEEF